MFSFLQQFVEFLVENGNIFFTSVKFRPNSAEAASGLSPIRCLCCRCVSSAAAGKSNRKGGSAPPPGGFAAGPLAFGSAESVRCGGAIKHEGGLSAPARRLCRRAFRFRLRRKRRCGGRSNMKGGSAPPFILPPRSCGSLIFCLKASLTFSPSPRPRPGRSPSSG